MSPTATAPPRAQVAVELDPNDRPRHERAALGVLPTRLAQVYVVLAMVTAFDAAPLLPRYRYLTVALGAGIALLAGWRAVSRIRLVLPFVLYAAWSVASLSWTVQSSFTMFEIRATVALVVTTMIVAGLLPVDVLTRAVVVAVEVVLAASVYYLVLHPETRLYDAYNPALGTAWRAGFVHKNNLSMFATLSVPCLLAFERDTRIRRGFLVLCVVLVLGSRSATGLIGITLTATTWWWVRLVQRRRPRSRAVAIGYTVPLVVAFVAGAILGVAGIANLLGKDITLTGRTHIWSAVMPKIGQRLWLGWGPGAFYGGSYNVYDADVIRNAGFFHPHTHNALLELLLNDGLVGTLLAAAFLVTLVVGAVRLFDRAPIVTRWTIAIVLPMIAMSASERTLPEAGWFCLLVVIRVVQLRCLPRRSRDPRADILPLSVVP